VIQREGHLKSVDRHAAISEERSRTVHKHVQPSVLGQNLIRQLPDRGLRGEVRAEEFDLIVCGGLAYLLHRGLTLLGIATDEHDVRAHRGERARGGLADARRGSRDQAHAASQRVGHRATSLLPGQSDCHTRSTGPFPAI
jgi:hypothetical protein